MSFIEVSDRYNNFDFNSFFNSVTYENIEKVLDIDTIDANQFLTLLSPLAGHYLEDMAKKAHQLTVQYFGRTIRLYTPLYVSNYCENNCVYCGFNITSDVTRMKLKPEEVDREAKFIASTGLRHILLLAGESRKESPVSYIKDCVRILKKYFSSIAIEIYALTESEYKELICEGVDGLTLYQEVYDRDIYKRVHGQGPKSNYLFRLNAPERAAKEGMRTVNIGVLLGLNRWREEILFTGLHARYLEDKFSDTEISVSIPRIRPHAGRFVPPYEVADKDIVHIVLALRIFLPRIGITLSTREGSRFRENLIPLGVTRMSAGSTTAVGGHTIQDNRISPQSLQFEISDTRSVDEVKKMLLEKDYQPVLKDWVELY